MDQLDQLSRYVGSESPALDKMGGADWTKRKAKARKAVREISSELIKLYAARQATRLPVALDYAQVRGLSKEVQQKLNQHKPETIGQAGRIQGVTPAAISLLLVWLKRRDLAARAGAAAPEAAALANAADDVARRPAA